uniref:Uncharacterized protein n=1 Tax=Ciona intestinalis TaxID=7719 RepID=F6W3W9_CIOIN
MSNNWPKEWISVVLSRFDRLLELSVTQNTSLTSTIDNHKACLINISQSKCLAVIRGLTSSLKKLSNIRIYGERQEYNLYNAQVVVLDLLGKCIAVKDLTLAGDSVLMRLLLCEVCQFLHQSTPDNPALSQLQSSASHVLYRISRNNFTVVFARISSRLQELTLSNDELADLSDLFLIQHIYLDLERISKILEDVAKCFKLLRRPFQNALLSILDKALCDWLSSFPLDVEEQRKMNATLSFNAEMLFHMVDNFSEGIKKKSVPYWPLQTSLLILCPFKYFNIFQELLKQMANNPDEVKNTKLFKLILLKRFIHLELLPHIKKSLSNPTSRHLHECCITAIIRLFKAATSISPPSEGEDGSLQKIVRELLPLVQNVVDPTSRENGSKFAKVCCRDLLIDCFICSYRLEPTKHNLAKFCASSVSSILHKMVWMNALLCISSQVCSCIMFLDFAAEEPCLFFYPAQPTHPWWPCMDGMLVYGPDVRKIFYDCSAKTQTLYQTSPNKVIFTPTLREKMNVSLKRSQDDSPSCKDLLHVILQLVHQNPSFILHNMGGSPQQIHQNLSEFFNTLVSLIDLKNTPNIPCSLASLEALVRLNEPQCVVGWNPEYMMVTYWEISSNVILTICEKVLTQQMMMSPDMLSHAIKWLNKMLAYRIEFLVQNHDKPGVNNKADVVKRAQLKTELVLLEQLWNSNPEIVLIALNCFHCLNEENEIKWSLNEFTMARLFPDNHEVYHHLSSCDVCEDGIQIKVAKKLRLVNKFT